MSGGSIPIFYSEELARFNFGQGHPFRSDRFSGFMQRLDDAGFSGLLDARAPEPATREELLLAHTEAFADRVKHLADTGGRLTLDTPANNDVLDIQTLIAGSGIQAAQLLLEDDFSTAHTFGGFHHAGADYGEGFCLLNDVAIVGKWLLEKGGLDRIMIVDTDAHQGNGTMDIFYDDPRVLFISIHQDPRTLYPGRGFVDELGDGEGMGYTVNIPMPPYAGNRQYNMAMEEIVGPVAGDFQPQLIIRNGGSDPYYGDELTLLGLDYEGLAHVNGGVREIADETCGRMLDMCVSGYGQYVVEGWLAIFAGVEKLKLDFSELRAAPGGGGYPEETLDKLTEKMLEALKAGLSYHWEL